MKRFETSLLEIVQLRGGTDILRNAQKTLDAYTNLNPKSAETAWIREAYECGAIPYLLDEIDRKSVNYTGIKNRIYQMLNSYINDTTRNAMIMICIFRAVGWKGASGWNEMADQIAHVIPGKRRIVPVAVIAAAVLCIGGGAALIAADPGQLVTQLLEDSGLKKADADDANGETVQGERTAGSVKETEQAAAVSDTASSGKASQASSAAEDKVLDLNWSDKELTDISRVRNYPDLEMLNIDLNRIQDLTPLSSLSRLQDLSMYHNPCSDLTPLNGLTGLLRLNMGETAITDLSPIAALTDLTYIDLWYTRVSDISALSGMTGLQSVYLSHTMVTSIEPLVNLPNITTLSISDLAISDGSLDRFVQTHPNCKIYNYTHEDELNNPDAYVMPQSDVYELSEVFLKRYTKRELWLAKNEIFARRGRRFNNQELQSFFDGKSWYRGTISPETFDANSNLLSEIEKKNVEILIAMGADSYLK